MKLCSHLSRMTDNKHQHNPAEEGRHGVVPSVGAGDSIVKVCVPKTQLNYSLRLSFDWFRKPRPFTVRKENKQLLSSVFVKLIILFVLNFRL